MAKEDLIQLNGYVEEVLPNAMFRVKITATVDFYAKRGQYFVLPPASDPA